MSLVIEDCFDRATKAESFADRHTLRFTYMSPSSLTAHLPQATLTIASITHLTQLLFDEVSRCLLDRICDVGSEMCESVHGTWFVDLLAGRTVGRWEGHVLYVHSPW